MLLRVLGCSDQWLVCPPEVKMLEVLGIGKPDPCHLIWEAEVRPHLVLMHDTIQQVSLTPNRGLPGAACPPVAMGVVGLWAEGTELHMPGRHTCV